MSKVSQHISNKLVNSVEKLESTTVIKDNKFEVGLLWKKDNIILPYNRELAEKRLYSLEKKFTKNQHFKQLYEQQISDYI